MDGAKVAAALLCAVMSTNALCAHVLTVRGWIKLMYSDTESLKKEVDAARSEHLDDVMVVRSRKGDK